MFAHAYAKKLAHNKYLYRTQRKMAVHKKRTIVYANEIFNKTKLSQFVWTLDTLIKHSHTASCVPKALFCCCGHKLCVVPTINMLRINKYQHYLHREFELAKRYGWTTINT